jgi:hypothetical protein
MGRAKARSSSGRSVSATLSITAVVIAALAMLLAGCSGSGEAGGSAGAETSIRAFSDEDLAAVEAQEGVSFDETIGGDGGGSLRIEALGPMVVRLFTVEDVDMEEATLIYRAKLRSEGLAGTAYPEMWCSFAELGDYFSRGVDSKISGDNDWTSRQTPFFLEKGQNPDAVQLNLVVDGTGTVWIDQVELLRAPLK